MGDVVQFKTEETQSKTPRQTELFENENTGSVVSSDSVCMVNNSPLIIREIYNHQRVVTFEVIDKLHGRPIGTAYRNFVYNKKHFIEGSDYFLFEGGTGRQALQDANYTNFVELPSSPNFSFCLITQTGYLMLVKSLRDETAWLVQRELVTSYFQKKESMGGMFDLMRKMIDAMEVSQKALDITQKSVEESKQHIEEVTTKIDIIDQRTNAVVDKSYKQAFSIAKDMHLFSINRLPHSAIVTAIARLLDMQINQRNWAEDRNTKTVLKVEGEARAWEVYYKPFGVDRILGWWKLNKDLLYFKEFYVRNSKNGKIGELRKEGYRIGGKSYALKKC